MSKKERAFPWILGISASHNGAACLLHGSQVFVAIQEERLIRKKRARLFAGKASYSIPYCLKTAKIPPGSLDLVVYNALRPISLVDPKPSQSDNDHEDQNIARNPDLNSQSRRVPWLAIPHHYAHALSTFETSGFEESAVLVVDGAGSPFVDWFSEERKVIRSPQRGEREAISMYLGSETQILPLEKHLLQDYTWLKSRNAPGMLAFSSLGGMYAAVAHQIFGDASQAGKVMGLAPYGRAKIPLEKFYTWNDRTGFTYSEEVCEEFPMMERWPAHEGLYKDLAASVQFVLEEAMCLLAKRLRRLSGSKYLCIAGGVGLNCLANERVIRESGFEKVYVIPASEDSGVALGAAYYGLRKLKEPLRRRSLRRDSFGKGYSDFEIHSALKLLPGLHFTKSKNFLLTAADLLSKGKLVGWFQGGSELGPRALGQRSILADPRSQLSKNRLNEEVKFRESFRPFGPAVLEEYAHEWFDFGVHSSVSPFMLRVCPVRPDKQVLIPAVVHVDGSARIQTVNKDNKSFYGLLRSFYKQTGVPILLNTSFNVMGEPIVETPHDAIGCLLHSGLDFCLIHEWIIERKSTFRSVLDFYPQHHMPGIHAEVTRHSSWLILELINGNRSGWEILKSLKEEGYSISKWALEAGFTSLFRSSFITYADRPNIERMPLGPKDKPSELSI